MKRFLLTISIMILGISAFAGPPEPLIPAPLPRPSRPVLPEPGPDLKSLDSLLRQSEGLSALSPKLEKLDSLLKALDTLKISNITIEGDSILLTLQNDSTIVFPGLQNLGPEKRDNNMVQVGRRIVVDEGETINGNIVNVGADVVVKGKVSGSVSTIGGDIYVTSSGVIQEGAVALGGKVKVDPGGRVGNVRLALNEPSHGPREYLNEYRIWGIVFLLGYVIWFILSATCASLFKANVARVVEVVGARPWKSYLLGYLTYVLAFAAMMALIITILGAIPGAIGVPLLLLAGMILSGTAISNYVGQKLIHADSSSFKSFLYGTLVLSGLPGLLIISQLITGSLVLMILNWTLIGIFLFLVLPFGLGAVFTTRFGTRMPKTATAASSNLAQ